MYSRDQQVLAHLGLDSSLLSFLSFCCCCWTPLPSFSTCLTDPLGLSFLGDTVTSLLTVIQQELMGPFIFTPDFPWLFYSLSLCALVSGGGGVFFLSVFWCWVELMRLFPENGHCGAVKEAMGAWDLVLLLDVWPCMEKAMAPHSSTLAWKSPRIEEPGGLQSMGSLGVRHDWVTSLSLLCIGEGNGDLLQCSCLENPRDGGTCWAAVYGVAQSRTRLKRLSSSSSSSSRPFMSHLIFLRLNFFLSNKNEKNNNNC